MTDLGPNALARKLISGDATNLTNPFRFLRDDVEPDSWQDLRGFCGIQTVSERLQSNQFLVYSDITDEEVLRVIDQLDTLLVAIQQSVIRHNIRELVAAVREFETLCDSMVQNASPVF